MHITPQSGEKWVKTREQLLCYTHSSKLSGTGDVRFQEVPALRDTRSLGVQTEGRGGGKLPEKRNSHSM